MRGKRAFVLAVAAVVALLAFGILMIPAAAEEPLEATVAQIESNVSDQQVAIAAIEEQLKTAKIIAGVVSVVVVFLGLKTWVDIKKGIDEQLRKLLKKEIKGNDVLDSLRRSVARERVAKKITVLFAAENEEDADKIEDVRIFFEGQKYKVSKETMVADVKKLRSTARNYDAVVFCVPKREDGAAKADNGMLYSELAKVCAIEEKQCVLYCPDRIQINLSLLNDQYASTVLLHSKLRETLYMLLYFSPLNED